MKSKKSQNMLEWFAQKNEKKRIILAIGNSLGALFRNELESKHIFYYVDKIIFMSLESFKYMTRVWFFYYVNKIIFKKEKLSLINNLFSYLRISLMTFAC